MGGGRGQHTIEIIKEAKYPSGNQKSDIFSVGGGIEDSECNGLQTTSEHSAGVITVGNTNPSGRGQGGNCYFSEGVSPAICVNKNDGQRVAIPVLTPDRAVKRQNGRRFKEDGEESFTLTSQDKHGVAIEVEPVEMSGYELSQSEDEAHSLNCTDQRKVFGAHQTRTMVGYNATLKSGGGYHASSELSDGERLQGDRQSTDDGCDDVFLIDKGAEAGERDCANCISARENRGLSNRKQEGTLVCLKV